MVLFPDPRIPPGGGGRQVKVCGFYNPGRPSAVDVLCKAGFLGNFATAPASSPLVITRAGLSGSFTNAESAFQALKFWNRKHLVEFEQADGDKAFALKRTYSAETDRTYAGFGSNWNAMYAVLQVKFSIPDFRRQLVATGNAFLLEHNQVQGRDAIWSNDNNGTGTNWLGLQLMLLRDELTGKDDWTTWINSTIDLRTGAPRPNSTAWQDAVRSATNAIIRELPCIPLCARANCVWPTWNGAPGEYCSRSCRSHCSHGQGRGHQTRSASSSGLTRQVVPTATNRAVSSSGLRGGAPLLVGMRGRGSSSQLPRGLPKQFSGPNPTVLCCREGCNQPSWNGVRGEYCSRSCRDGRRG